MTSRLPFRIGTSLLSLVVYGAPAAAQEEAAKSGLDEIVVTAQKRTEDLQAVPIAVTVLGSQQLKSEALTRFEQLNTVVPNLISHPRSGATDFEMRGVGNFQTGEPAVQTYIDGVYMSSREATSTELPDVASIQVLKGPQGTLFGRNATAGVIAITTEAPPETFRARTELTYATYQTGSGRLWLGGPITDTLGATFSAIYTRQGKGWGTNLLNGSEVYKNKYDLTTRGKVVWDPTGTTSVTFLADYQHRKNNRFANYQPFGDTVGYYTLGTTRFPYRATSDLHDSLIRYPTVYEYRSHGGSVRVDQDLGGGLKLMSLTSYRQYKSHFGLSTDGPSPDPVGLDIYQRRRTATQEFQLTSPDSRKFNWVAGIYLYRDIYHVDPLRVILQKLSAPALESDLLTRTNVGSAAVYAQGTYSILPTTRLTVGGRFSYEQRRFAGQRPFITTFGTTPGAIFQATTTIKRPTWRFSLDHDLTDTIMAYVSYSRGIKSGGYAPLSQTFVPFKDEVLDDIEGGLKTKLFDNRVRLNVAAFHYNFHNIQLTSYTAGNALNNTISSGGDSEIYGLDADLQAKVSSAFSLRGGLGLLDSKIKGGVLVAFLQPNPAGGNIRSSQDPRGKQLPFAPHLTGNAGINYDHDFSFGGINVNATVSYIGHQYVGADNFLRVPATTQLGASVSWTTHDGRFTVQLWGRNLTDEIVYGQITQSDNGNFADVGEPRTYGITLKAKLGS